MSSPALTAVRSSTRQFAWGIYIVEVTRFAVPGALRLRVFTSIPREQQVEVLFHQPQELHQPYEDASSKLRFVVGPHIDYFIASVERDEDWIRASMDPDAFYLVVDPPTRPTYVEYAEHYPTQASAMTGAKKHRKPGYEIYAVKGEQARTMRLKSLTPPSNAATAKKNYKRR